MGGQWRSKEGEREERGGRREEGGREERGRRSTAAQQQRPLQQPLRDFANPRSGSGQRWKGRQRRRVASAVWCRHGGWRGRSRRCRRRRRRSRRCRRRRRRWRRRRRRRRSGRRKRSMRRRRMRRRRCRRRRRRRWRSRRRIRRSGRRKRSRKSGRRGSRSMRRGRGRRVGVFTYIGEREEEGPSCLGALTGKDKAPWSRASRANCSEVAARSGLGVRRWRRVSRVWMMGFRTIFIPTLT